MSTIASALSALARPLRPSPPRVASRELPAVDGYDQHLFFRVIAEREDLGGP